VLLGPALAAAEVSLGQDAKVLRPGVRVAVQSPEGPGYCTAGFMYAGGDGAVYFAMAGHCVVPNSPVHMGSAPVGVVAVRLPDAVADFALVRVLPGVDWHPAVRGLGPTTGSASCPTDAAPGDIVKHSGNPGGVPPPNATLPYALWPEMGLEGEVGADGADLPPWVSQGVVISATDGHMHYAGVAFKGNSGSPVMTEDGRALAILIALYVGIGPAGEPAANLRGVCLSKVVPMGEAQLGTQLTLL
jgi:hypothetical protein